MPEIIVVAHNIRSTHNVGSIFRTAEGFGVKQIILSGYTPYPIVDQDSRLPHIRDKIADQIHKTALGTEKIVPFAQCETLDIRPWQQAGYRIVGLEQDSRSHLLPNYQAPDKLVLILGEEVAGIASEIRNLCNDLIEIPMHGTKESYNVSVATGIALYALTT